MGRRSGGYAGVMAIMGKSARTTRRCHIRLASGGRTWARACARCAPCPELPSPRFNLGGYWLTVVAVHDRTWLKPMPDDAWHCVVASPCRSILSEDQNQTKRQRAKGLLINNRSVIPDLA